MAYTLTNINLKNTTSDAWRLIRISEDELAKDQHGQLFCIAELEQTHDEGIDIIEELIDTIFTLFEEQDRFTATRPEDLLEHILEEANRLFTTMTESVDTGTFSHLSIILGIIKNDSLVISRHGTLEAWLLHPFAKRAENASYRWINILENQYKSNGSVSGKLFDQVIAGELSERQPFVISSKNLFQVFTKDEFKDLILTNRLKRIKMVVVKMVNSLPAKTDVAMIIAKDERLDKKSDPLPPAQKERDTVFDETAEEQLEEKRREKHRIIAKLFGTMRERSGKKSAGKAGHQPLKENQKKIDQSVSGIGAHVETKFEKSKHWFFKLPVKAKLIFVAAFVLIVIFIQSISFINVRNQDKKISVQFNEQMSQIQLRRDEAEAKLIYNDKTSARKLIEEALTLAYNLPERYQKEENQKQELTEALTQTLQEIDGLETFETLEVVYTFPEELQLTQVHEMIALRTGLMIVAVSEPKLIAIDVAANSARKITLNAVEGTITDTAWDKPAQTLYLLTSENKIFKAPLSEVDSSTDAISPEKLNFSIADIGAPSLITFYANRLYVVDPIDKQIKKLDLLNNSVSNWLSQEQSGLGAIVDLLIDGNIYLVSQDSVTQYFKGEKTDFSLSGLVPAPSTIIASHADIDDTYIYLLENVLKRIILLNPDGTLFKQFSAKELTNPANFTVNEPEREIYILDNHTIYRTPITWIE